MNTASEINAKRNKGFARRDVYRVEKEGNVSYLFFDGIRQMPAKIVRCISTKKNAKLHETFQMWTNQNSGIFRATTKGAGSIDQLIEFCKKGGETFIENH